MSNELSLAEKMRLANLNGEIASVKEQIKELMPEITKAYTRYIEKKLIEKEGERKSALAYQEYEELKAKYVSCVTRLKEAERALSATGTKG
ncbi:MAG: hypothetical protein IJ004_02185 [Clostridia bacterium]|nr:hypothetical protein [Clostridia bacterium]